MPYSPSDNIFEEPFWIALVILTVAGGTILAALAFEHIGGYQPCALCLMQRTPYYLGVPLAAGIAVAIWAGASGRLVALLFAALAALMLYNFGLAGYHPGVEWAWWEGPATCAPSTSVGSAGDLFNTLQSGVRGPSCTEAVWRFAGLSFAGWNVLISLALAVLAGLGAAKAYGSSSASQ